MPFPDVATIQSRVPGIVALNLLAQGGQKIVFRAEHQVHGNVVLKLAGADERTRREIEAVTSFAFSNVPKIYEWGELKHGNDTFVYLIEERVDGQSLREQLNRDSKLSLADTITLLRCLLETAVEMESQRLVHRDIKPENIMIGTDGKCWLLDFGIARHLDKSSLTQTAQHFGPATFGYAAPEQLRNLKQHIDIRADLFAIGLVAYECLTGSNPFISGARDVLEVALRTASVRIPPAVVTGDTQRELAGFIGALTAKSASLRPQTAQQALDWFNALLPAVDLSVPGAQP